MSDMMRRGRATLLKYLGYREVYREPTDPQYLEDTLQSFDFSEALVTLARMNLLLWLGAQAGQTGFMRSEEILRENFMPPCLRVRLDSRGLGSRPIFSRRAVLRLLQKLCSDMLPGSQRDFREADARYDLGSCVLAMNDLFDSGGETERGEDLLPELFPIYEYARRDDIARTMPRTRRLLDYVQRQSARIELSAVFSRATGGLTLDAYQYLVSCLLLMYRRLNPDQVIGGDPGLILDAEQLFSRTDDAPHFSELLSRLMRYECISINDLRGHASLQGVADDLSVFRRHPLVALDRNKFICIDPILLADKLDTGVFWIVHGQLRDDGLEPTIADELWGKALEAYASEVMVRATSESSQICILSPRYENSNDECTDILIQDDDALLLMECKGSLLTAQAKYGRSFDEFEQDLRRKFIVDNSRERPKPKALMQLQRAICSLACSDDDKRRNVPQVEISEVNRIFPTLVVREQALSTPFMNQYMDHRFNQIARPYPLLPHIQIMPLTIMLISDLEDLEPHLHDERITTHLDGWLRLCAAQNDASFRDYLYEQNQQQPRRNASLDAEFRRVSDEITRFFFGTNSM